MEWTDGVEYQLTNIAKTHHHGNGKVVIAVSPLLALTGLLCLACFLALIIPRPTHGMFCACSFFPEISTYLPKASMPKSFPPPPISETGPACTASSSTLPTCTSSAHPQEPSDTFASTFATTWVRGLWIADVHHV